jgi:molybdate transport system substrate-binding protein
LTKKEVMHVAIANPAHAPYGVAAKAALQSRGIWNQIEKKIVFGENVRQALQFAESGNAEAVITSWTLLHDRGGVLLPAEWHAPIRQAGAVVSRSKNADVARRFLDWLTGPAGRDLLLGYGLFRAN